MTEQFNSAAALSPMVQPVEIPKRGLGLGTLFSVQTLKLAAQLMARSQHNTSFDTRDLVKLLTSQTARNRRIAQPRATVRMHLPVQSSDLSVRMYYGG